MSYAPEENRGICSIRGHVKKKTERINALASALHGMLRAFPRSTVPARQKAIGEAYRALRGLAVEPKEEA